MVTNEWPASLGLTYLFRGMSSLMKNRMSGSKVPIKGYMVTDK